MGDFFLNKLIMKILCNGCSFTYGHGFLDHERGLLSYPGLLAKDLSAEVVNVAVPGSSNLEILLRTLRTTQDQSFDLIVVQWTELRRHWFEPCLGYQYRTASPVDTKWTHGIHLTKKQRQNLKDQLSMLTGDYKTLLDLAYFCQILMQYFANKVIFLNGLLPITTDLISALPTENHNMHTHFSDFTKSVLEFDDKPDTDIKKYHTQLVQAFFPSLDNWANIDNSWQKNIVDIATEGHHPGPKSHRWAANQIISQVLDQ
jgi:hypothetical protein